MKEPVISPHGYPAAWDAPNFDLKELAACFEPGKLYTIDSVTAHRMGREMFQAAIDAEVLLHETGKDYSLNPLHIKAEARAVKPVFSVFKAPVRNTRPLKEITLADAYKAVSKEHYRPVVEQIRAAPDKSTASKLKAGKLPYFTFSGTFTQRANEHLKEHSGLICMDIDDLPPDALPDVKTALLTDTRIETELLFTSPSGNGLKWVVAIDAGTQAEHLEYFLAIEDYLHTKHRLNTDKACKDVARACFVSYDANAFINSKHCK